MRNKLLLTLLIAALALSGCGIFGKKKGSQGVVPAPVLPNDTLPSGAPPGTFPAPVQIGPGSATAVPGFGGANGSGEEALGGTIYFEYDSTTLTGESVERVARAGKYLSEHAATRARLEGHTDERGSREYNVGLGERRAQAVQDSLLRAGATPAQLTVISFGEERPAASGHGESSWAKNRRVEIMR